MSTTHCALCGLIHHYPADACRCGGELVPVTQSDLSEALA